MLNDGRYGYSVGPRDIGLSLLRAPVFPDPLADEGSQGFTYSFYAFQGDWQSGGVVGEAEDLNRPLVATAAQVEREEAWQAVCIDGADAVVAALKPADRGKGAVLRLYEPGGRAGRVRIGLMTGWKIACDVDILERVVGVPPSYEIRPFQVRSWLLERD